MYFLRHIIHDWPDKDAKKILDSLRTAAGAHSKLILFEGLARHVTEDPGTGAQSVPYPLLPNSGAEFLTTLDMGVSMHMVWIYESANTRMIIAAYYVRWEGEDVRRICSVREGEWMEAGGSEARKACCADFRPDLTFV